MLKQIDFRPVILAGGSGTRFWPRSRRARAKQVLALDGERSMIQQTVERLKPLASLAKTWIITNEFLAGEIADQLPGLPGGQIVREPVARNTAPACGLAAFIIERDKPDAVLGVFPSDHVIADEPRFLKALTRRLDKVAGNQKRDAELAAKVAPSMRAYEQLATQAHRHTSHAELARLQWMIEELRVSLFAQDLRTALPVSEKRVAEQIERARAESARAA